MKPVVYANWLMMNYKWKQCVLSSFFPIIISKHCISYSLFPNIFHVFSLPWSLNISLQNRFSFHLLKKKKKKTKQNEQQQQSPWRSDSPSLPFHFIHSFIHIPIHKVYSLWSFFFKFSSFPGLYLIFASKLCLLDSNFGVKIISWVFWHSKWFVL